MHQCVFGKDVLEFVALAVQLLPQDVFELVQSLPRNGRDKHCGKIVGKGFAQHLNEFFVQQIALGDGQDAMFVVELRVEVVELFQQNLIFFLDVVGIAGHHKKQ